MAPRGRHGRGVNITSPVSASTTIGTFGPSPGSRSIQSDQGARQGKLRESLPGDGRKLIFGDDDDSDAEAEAEDAPLDWRTVPRTRRRFTRRFARGDGADLLLLAEARVPKFEVVVATVRLECGGVDAPVELGMGVEE